MKTYKNEFNWERFKETLISAMGIPDITSRNCPRALQTFVENAMARQLVPPLALLDELHGRQMYPSDSPATLALQSAFFACGPYNRKTYWLAALLPSTLWQDETILRHMFSQCDIETVVVAGIRAIQGELPWETAQRALELACQATQSKDYLDLEITQEVIDQWLSDPNRADHMLQIYEWTTRKNPTRLAQWNLLLGTDNENDARAKIFLRTTYYQQGILLNQWSVHCHWAYESGWIDRIKDQIPALNILEADTFPNLNTPT